MPLNQTFSSKLGHTPTMGMWVCTEQKTWPCGWLAVSHCPLKVSARYQVIKERGAFLRALLPLCAQHRGYAEAYRPRDQLPSERKGNTRLSQYISADHSYVSKSFCTK